MVFSRFKEKKDSAWGIASLTKDGYTYSEKEARGGLYSGGGDQDYKPNRFSPEIFTMIHHETAEPLIHYDAHLLVPCDGTPVRLNTITGKVTDDGDFQITLIREPYNIVRGGSHFSWSVKVEVIGGGLVELLGTGTYRAPEGGYESSFGFSQSADAEKWGGGLRKTFYIKTREGRYGRVRLALDAYYQPPPAKAGLEVYMNPRAGSRILEYDPNKQAPAR